MTKSSNALQLHIFYYTILACQPPCQFPFAAFHVMFVVELSTTGFFWWLHWTAIWPASFICTGSVRS